MPVETPMPTSAPMTPATLPQWPSIHPLHLEEEEAEAEAGLALELLLLALVVILLLFPPLGLLLH